MMGSFVDRISALLANLTRPERYSTAMKSKVRITDAMLWVMITKVAPVSSWIFFTSSSR